ncbi:hypothetical protein J1C67_14940 [Clostridium gasigenes]|uniref:hypothetical protein n=1 Tax=Clostridium gasigenes TaxID=94869 RepID=UPI0014384E09|nr:hypothetical protein [Clostridium gasigenes]NKF05379.1 hypothetical protein [Clostridium gasigenes]QSW18829.1 hypothetical protein J1C67_14940 [Clostridium gasigenes]
MKNELKKFPNVTGIYVMERIIDKSGFETNQSYSKKVSSTATSTVATASILTKEIDVELNAKVVTLQPGATLPLTFTTQSPHSMLVLDVAVTTNNKNFSATLDDIVIDNIESYIWGGNSTFTV